MSNKMFCLLGLFLHLLSCWADTVTTSVAEEPNTKPPSATSASTAERYPVINVKDQCGAVGDGKTNDTVAFQKAADMIQKAGGGTLVIPQATYLVGAQDHVEGKVPFYQPQRVFTVEKLDFLLIDGNGATLRYPDGLRFGSFDPKTGEVYNPPQMPFYNGEHIAQLIPMFNITGSRHVTVRNIELDGNSQHILLGGTWGDVGRQLGGDGLVLYGNTDVQVSKVKGHHFPRDGIMIGWTGLKADGPATPHTLTDCTFDYNGRQALSWVGGRGIKALRCKFNHTGRVLIDGTPLASAPGAGLDIEAEDSVCRDGYFEDCEFIDNFGCGLVADQGDGGYSRFVRCTFWGTTNWSAWLLKPALKFSECNFYGSLVYVFGSADAKLATSFSRCNFEDKPWTNGLAYRRNSNLYLVEVDSVNQLNVSFDDCSFTANTCRSIWFNAGGGPGYFTNCTFLHKADKVKSGEFQALLHNTVLKGCRFKEEFPPETAARWYIAAENTRIAEGAPTVVDGPRVHWANPNGAVGAIAP